MRIKFVCPTCDGIKLIQVAKKVTIVTTHYAVVVIDKEDNYIFVDGEDMVLPEIIDDDTTGYECNHCGEKIAITNEELLTWLQEHDMVE